MTSQLNSANENNWKKSLKNRKIPLKHQTKKKIKI